jgi:hypothetical protein
MKNLYNSKLKKKRVYWKKCYCSYWCVMQSPVMSSLSQITIFMWCNVVINVIFITCFDSIICYIGKIYIKHFFQIVILRYKRHISVQNLLVGYWTLVLWYEEVQMIARNKGKCGTKVCIVSKFQLLLLTWDNMCGATFSFRLNCV